MSGKSSLIFSVMKMWSLWSFLNYSGKKKLNRDNILLKFLPKFLRTDWKIKSNVQVPVFISFPWTGNGMRTEFKFFS